MFMTIKQKLNSKMFEFIRFILVGGCATAIHYVFYLGFSQGLRLNPNLAYTLGYGISFLFNYWASTRFTFWIL